MGADIHAYVEYVDFITHDGDDYWSGLTKNFGDRNYYLFGLLAGVRGSDGPLFPVRGMPEGRISYDTAGDYWLNVTDDPTYEDHEGYTIRHRAEEWVSKGYSVADMRDGRMVRVSGPDYHSHSWLTTDELAIVLQHYAENVQSVWPESKAEAPVAWQAVLAAMQTFERNGKKARVIFWFDN
jgi:hypothetical protein